MRESQKTMNDRYIIVAFIGKTKSRIEELIQAINLPEYPLNFIRYHSTQSDLNKNEFTAKLLNNEFYDVFDNNGIFYGLSADCLQIDRINVGYFSPDSISNLAMNLNVLYPFVFFVDVDDKARFIKLLDTMDIDDAYQLYIHEVREFADLGFQYNTLTYDYTEESFKNNVKYMTEFFDILCGRNTSNQSEENSNSLKE